MRELKDDVSPQKFAVTVLGSLPESYDVFLTSLNARDAQNMDWDNIKPLLVEEFMKRKEKEQKKKDDEALFTYRQGPSSRGGGKARGGDNDRGQDGGQDKKKFPPKKYPPQGPRGPPQCWRCKEWGHKHWECTAGSEEGNFVDSDSGNKRVKLEKESSPFLESDVALMTSTGNDDASFERVELEKESSPVLQSDVAQVTSNSNDDASIETVKLEKESSPFLESDVALVTSNGNDDASFEDWYIDSAATSHMTYNKNIIREYVPYEQPDTVTLGDKSKISSIGEGKVRLETPDSCLALQRVVHVPTLAKNLLSVPAMCKNDATVTFDKEKCVVYKDGEEHIIGSAVNGKLYKVNQPKREVPPSDSAYVTTNSNRVSSELWHNRFGHLNNKYLKEMSSKKMVEGLSIVSGKEESSCEACIMGKMQKISCPKESQHRATKLLEVIHSDVCGPMQVDSVGGSRYLLTFTDDFSRYKTVYFLKNIKVKL